MDLLHFTVSLDFFLIASLPYIILPEPPVSLLTADTPHSSQWAPDSWDSVWR